MLNRLKIISLISILLLPSQKASSGWLPFLTNSPEPVNYQQWELYLYGNLNKNNAFLLEPQLSAPTVEIDWGVLSDVNLHAMFTYAWAFPDRIPATSGPGDSELGIKYRLIHETDWLPQIGFAPLLELPTGNTNRNLGNGVPWVQLPLWLQKSWGPWTTVGGAGYALNSAPGMLDYFYAGWELQKKLNDTFTLGAEFFYQDAQSIDSSAATFFNAGGYYYFSQHTALLFSAGHTMTGTSQLLASLGLYWTSET